MLFRPRRAVAWAAGLLFVLGETAAVSVLYFGTKSSLVLFAGPIAGLSILILTCLVVALPLLRMPSLSGLDPDEAVNRQAIQMIYQALERERKPEGAVKPDRTNRLDQPVATNDQTP
jgi:hypothetical protein